MKIIAKAIFLTSVLLLIQGTMLSFICRVKADYVGNYCLNFNGTDNYVDCSGSQIFKQQNLTVEAWVKPEYPVKIGSHPLYYNQSYGVVVSYAADDGYSYAGTTGWWLRFNYDDGTLRFGWRYSSFWYFEYREYGTNKATWSNDSWYHIAVTFNPTLPSGNLKFYINGTLDSQDTDSYSIRYGTSRFQIGGFVYGYYGGLIDEVRVWNVTKTQSEVSDTWQRTLSNTENANPNLIGYWRLDEGGGTDTHDYSIQGNDGSLLPYSHPPQWVTPGAPIVSDQTPPTISILSPENTTYTVSDVSLTFTLNESASWIGYSLDGGTNVTISGNSTLTGLLVGLHYVVVYANDTSGNMGASSTVYFTVDDTTPPNITDVSQTPLANNVQPVDIVEIQATVTDDLSGVKKVTLNYTNGNGTWIIVAMTNLEVNIWNATIPAFPYCTNVTYIIIAEDNANNIITTEELGQVYEYHVIPEFPSAMILPLFMILSLISVVFMKLKKKKQ